MPGGEKKQRAGAQIWCGGADIHGRRYGVGSTSRRCELFFRRPTSQTGKKAFDVISGKCNNIQFDYDKLFVSVCIQESVGWCLYCKEYELEVCCPEFKGGC